MKQFRHCVKIAIVLIIATQVVGESVDFVATHPLMQNRNFIKPLQFLHFSAKKVCEIYDV